jgi:parvulin-like peptidyl-prolyl isomerase
MTKQKAAPPLSRKHLALARRERLFSRILIIGVGLALASVAVLIGYGMLEQQVLLPRRPAAVVNGDEILRSELLARTSLQQADLVQQRRQLAEMSTFFVESPEAQASLEQQIARIDSQLNNPNLLAAQVLQELIQARLIRQEAARRGITVSDAEIQRAIEEAFGFFADGTPTPAPTATVDATLVAQSTADVARTPTAAPGPTNTPAPTATASLTPVHTATVVLTATPPPTATPYTREGFEVEWQQYLDDVASALGVEESYIRDRFADDLYRDRLRAAFEESIPIDQEQVWAKHILLPDEGVAQATLDRLKDGEDWDELAAEVSLDPSNKDAGGDLGWFARGRMVDAFEEAAFEGEPGEIIGPVQSDFGWHLILIVDRAMRRLSPAAHETAVDDAFTTWLTSALEQAEMTFDPEIVPPTVTPAAISTASADASVTPASQ